MHQSYHIARQHRAGLLLHRWKFLLSLIEHLGTLGMLNLMREEFFSTHYFGLWFGCFRFTKATHDFTYSYNRELDGKSVYFDVDVTLGPIYVILSLIVKCQRSNFTKYTFLVSMFLFFHKRYLIISSPIFT